MRCRGPRANAASRNRMTGSQSRRRRAVARDKVAEPAYDSWVDALLGVRAADETSRSSWGLSPTSKSITQGGSASRAIGAGDDRVRDVARGTREPVGGAAAAESEARCLRSRRVLLCGQPMPLCAAATTRPGPYGPGSECSGTRTTPAEETV